MKETTLPSGAILKIGTIPFSEAWSLNSAMASEAKSISFNSETEMSAILKDVICIGISSKLINDALWKCLARCIYSSGKGDLKIDKETFEPEEARQDFIEVCMEVGKSALLPFLKNHFAEYSRILEALKSSPELKPKTTQS